MRMELLGVSCLVCLYVVGCATRLSDDWFIVSKTAPKAICYYKSTEGAIILEWQDPASFVTYRSMSARLVMKDGKRAVEIVLYAGIPATGATLYSDEIARDAECKLRVAIAVDVTPGKDVLYMKGADGELAIPFAGNMEMPPTIQRYVLQK